MYLIDFMVEDDFRTSGQGERELVYPEPQECEVMKEVLAVEV